ncbi:hypothetical protein FJT64_003108 [Amphibalanus amphitrite]|uniref:Uncharacterized protein n=1 Tax=Amphibalanus amphitrite TaxID=1232801 RepID=A0A6A4WF81_AMPAM|nr:hypothetical protein FJT64_003108 [Amphibalanus amphitrite]
MEGRLRTLEETANELLAAARQPCSGCQALSRRVEALERRLGPEPESEGAAPHVDTLLPPDDPAGESAGHAERAAEEDPDPVDLLLREAQQLGAGVLLDEDLDELLDVQSLAEAETTAPAAPSATEPSAPVRFIPYVGRAMTIMRRQGRAKRHVVAEEVAATYFSDRLGIHLNKKGYARVLDKISDVFF